METAALYNANDTMAFSAGLGKRVTQTSPERPLPTFVLIKSIIQMKAEQRQKTDKKSGEARLFFEWEFQTLSGTRHNFKAGPTGIKGRKFVLCCGIEYWDLAKKALADLPQHIESI